jgi:biopolymer transport protein ExbB/TolQ
MIRIVIGLIIFGLIALAIIILVVINFSYKSLRQLRKAAEDQWELNQKRKEQKEKNPFGDDYFKSSDTGPHQSNRTQQTKRTQEQSQKTTTRKTTTSSGVTIIDEREEDKKIFTHDDGEYVEFEEV